MTKSISTVLSISMLAMLVFFACKKDVDEFIPDPGDGWPTVVNGDIGELFNALRPIPDQYILNQANNGTVTTPLGTRIQLPTNYLLREDGSPVGNESVILDFIEIFTPGEMIAANKPTITLDGRLLRSDGVFYAQPKLANGEELSLIPFRNMGILFARENPDEDMIGFLGWEQDTTNTFRWQEVEEGLDVFLITLPDTTTADPIDSLTAYAFYSQFFGWLNCDEFYEFPPDQKTAVCVQLPNQYTNVNAAVFVVFKNLNSVMDLNGNPELELFCQSNLPIGWEVTLVALASDGPDSYLLGHVDVIITPNMVAEIEPESATVQEILDYLGGL